jgi:hypothetical protein
MPVPEPLADITRRTAPVTLAGVTAMACFMREYNLSARLWARSVDRLDFVEASLRVFIDRAAMK